MSTTPQMGLVLPTCYSETHMPRKDKEARKAYLKAYYLRRKDELCARQRAYSAEHREQISAGNRRRYHENHDARMVYQRSYYTENRDRILEFKLLKEHGISWAEFDAMLERQGGVCAICGSAEGAGYAGRNASARLHVDHDHKTGKVRGLLCANCNKGLGSLKDDPATLRRAANYLDDSRRVLTRTG